MRISLLARFVSILCFLAALLAWGQTASAPAAAPSSQISPADLSALVKTQFGPGFEIVTQSPLSKIGGAKVIPDETSNEPWNPLLIGDFDGDGVEDVAIIARNKNALIGSDAYGYKVTDPYNEHFGYGTVSVTMDFNSQDPVHNLDLLIIHGVGKEGWRADKPKAKYVIINIPFELASVARATLKKKVIDAIRVEESDTMSSLVFWDGKKYRYSPGGGSL